MSGTYLCSGVVLCLQENDSKRARAEKKAADEIKARLTKEKEIEQLAQQLEELRTDKERMHEVLEKNMRQAMSLACTAADSHDHQPVLCLTPPVMHPPSLLHQLTISNLISLPSQLCMRPHS